jgi:hypothetical protein
MACIFPFQLNNVTHRRCTLVEADDGRPWCSLRTDRSVHFPPAHLTTTQSLLATAGMSAGRATSATAPAPALLVTGARRIQLKPLIKQRFQATQQHCLQ